MQLCLLSSHPHQTVTFTNIPVIVCLSNGSFHFSPKHTPALPLAPGQLEVSGDTPHQLRLSWSPPFTLPGETVSYSLLVTNLVTGLNQTLGPLSDTVYTHQLSETQALDCHPFLFSVFSLNEVGLSINSSSAPPALYPSGKTIYTEVYIFVLIRASLVAAGPLGSLEVEIVSNSQSPSGTRDVLHLILQVSWFIIMYLGL